MKTMKVAKYGALQGAEIRVIECWLSPLTSHLCHSLLTLCPMAQGYCLPQWSMTYQHRHILQGGEGSSMNRCFQNRNRYPSGVLSVLSLKVITVWYI